MTRQEAPEDFIQSLHRESLRSILLIVNQNVLDIPEHYFNEVQDRNRCFTKTIITGKEKIGMFT